MNETNFDNIEELEEYATITLQQIEPLTYKEPETTTKPNGMQEKKCLPRNDSKLLSNKTCLNKKKPPQGSQRPKSQFREEFFARGRQKESTQNSGRTSSRTARRASPLVHNEVKAGNRIKRKMSPKIGQKTVNISNDLANKENTVENKQRTDAQRRSNKSKFNIFSNTPRNNILPKGHVKTPTQVDLLKPLNDKALKKEIPNFRIINAAKVNSPPKVIPEETSPLELNRPRRRRADRKQPKFLVDNQSSS